MVTIDEVWPRIVNCSGQSFTTKTGMAFTYATPGQFLRVTRNGREVNRTLSRTNFERALAAMPAVGPSAIKDRQGSAYTWAFLMDPRVRQQDW